MEPVSPPQPTRSPRTPEPAPSPLLPPAAPGGADAEQRRVPGPGAYPGAQPRRGALPTLGGRAAEPHMSQRGRGGTVETDVPSDLQPRPRPPGGTPLMDPDFTPEQHEIRRTLRTLLAKRCGPDDVKAAVRTGPGYDPALWRQLAKELGLPGLAVPEAYGGVGCGVAELALACEETGRALLPSPLLATAALAAPFSSPSAPSRRSTRTSPARARRAHRDPRRPGPRPPAGPRPDRRQRRRRLGGRRARRGCPGPAGRRRMAPLRRGRPGPRRPPRRPPPRPRPHRRLHPQPRPALPRTRRRPRAAPNPAHHPRRDP